MKLREISSDAPLDLSSLPKRDVVGLVAAYCVNGAAVSDDDLEAAFVFKTNAKAESFFGKLSRFVKKHPELELSDPITLLDDTILILLFDKNQNELVSMDESVEWLASGTDRTELDKKLHPIIDMLIDDWGPEYEKLSIRDISYVTVS